MLGKSWILTRKYYLPMQLDNFVFSALFLLLVTSFTVVLFKRIGLGSILGLLVAGIIVGPHSPGPYISSHVDVEDVRHFTELGIVLLLFLIGLEMKPARLWAMRKMVFGMGSLQILLTGLVITAYTSIYQSSFETALLTGMALALSSTAFVMQLMQERGEIASPQGSGAFSVLLMQDLAIVPLLALVPFLSATGTLPVSTPLWEQILIVVGMLGLVWGFGTYLLPLALDWLASQGNREAFFLVVMLAVFLAAWAMHQAGLSMVLGVFMMGMLLSGSRYSLQIRAVIEPYKGLLMSLFFVAIGMSIDLDAVAEHPWLLLQHTLAIILIKIVVMFLLALAFGFPRNIATRISFLLAQGGEFGFVLFGSAKALQVIDDQTFVIGVGVISISMMLTPIMVKLGDLLVAPLERADPVSKHLCFIKGLNSGNDTPSPRVLIAGYGRVGHIVATLLRGSGVPFIVFDIDPARVAKGRGDGFPVYYGDISDPDLLAAAHTDDLVVVVLAIAHMPDALRAASYLRNAYPDISVIARAHDLAASGKLIEAGVTQVFPEIIESSLKLAANAMEIAGIPETGVDQLMDDARSENYQLVRMLNKTEDE